MTQLPTAWRRLPALLALTLVAGLLLLVPGLRPASAAPAADVTDGLLLRYDLDQTTGTTVADTSGHGRDGRLVGGGAWGGGALTLDGVDDHVTLPNDLLAGLDAVTVHLDVFVAPTQASPFFLWGLGNPATSASGTGYLFASGNGFRAGITPSNWAGEKVTARTSGGNLARGVWKSVTYTQTGTTGTLFEDGVQVGQNTAVTVLPKALGNGTTTRNVLGESNYAADNTLKGSVRNFRVYDRALSSSEVAAISLTDAARVAADADALPAPGTVTSDLTLPTVGTFGSAVAWASSDPAVVSTSGAVTRPAAGQPATTVTLTATVSRGAESTTRDIEVTVPAQDDDRARAQAAADALSLVDADDVRGSMTLPTSGLGGAGVRWSSAAPTVVSADGVVKRPAHGEGDESVVLTAEVSLGGATVTREFTLTVRELPAPAPYAGYAFSYFTGNSVAGENIYFAASRGNDALNWDELNGGQATLTSTFGERGLRDPFLIRSPEGDRFFLIATDLSIGRNGDWDRAQRQGSRYLEVWESRDLKTWSQQRHVLVSPPEAGNTWAPEAYWDASQQAYVVFWASKLYAPDDVNHTGSTYNRMLYATTRDFRTFSPAKIWQDVGDSRIDSTVIEEGGTYYRFTKDEGAGTTGCSDIIQEKNDVLTEPDLVGSKAWAFQAGCIGRDAGTRAVEGPSVFKANPGDTSGSKYYLFVDEYGGRGYIPLGTDDLEKPAWKVAPRYRLPSSPRHGTVVPVTAAELAALRADLPAPPPPVTSDADGLVLHYDLAGTDAAGGTGTTVVDRAGHGYDGTLVGGATRTDDGVRLDGTDDHVRLPNDMMAGLDELTVSTRVRIDATQPTPYFIWGLGNTDAGGTGRGYLFTTGDGRYRTSITAGDYNGEQTAAASSAVPRDTWATLTYTLKGGTAIVYLDGREVGRKDDVTVRPGDIGDGRTSANYIGRSLYDADKFLTGTVSDFRLYSRALSAAEVKALGADPTGIAGVTLDALAVPATIDGASSTVTLPVRPGTDLTRLAPTFDLAPGSTVSPTGTLDLSSPRTVTVTSAKGATRQWTVRAVPLRTPVLPGLYADPNIAVFGDTYYIYATTDGFPGWGGKEFYVWSSKDLVDWKRSEKPILTLDGANGDVPWATGNAWAPTITERDGKYYFYFSGHNAALNRKTIGVAVASSPTGPFTAQPNAMILNNEAVTSGQAIDPAAFEDPATGKHYLFWGNGSPLYAELADDMTSLVPGSIKRISGLTDFREGTFVNYRKGTYHLTYAIDDTGSPDYRVGYATATSIDGPWTYRGVILSKDPSQGILGTGHSSIVQVPGTDEWVIAYHRFALATFTSPGGDGTHRETTLDRITFGDDGLIEQVRPTLTGVDSLVEPAPPAPVATARPLVTGSAQVGGRLVASPGRWDTDGLTYGYQWLRDGVAIPGARQASYVVRGGDVGHRLSVRVTASLASGPSGTSTSGSTSPVRRAGAQVRLGLSDPTPRAGQRVAVRLRVVADGGAAVTGRVRVRVDGRTVWLRAARDGLVRVPVRFSRGRHVVTVTYSGSATVAGDAARLEVRVRR